MEKNIQPDYQKLLDPIVDITISVESLLDDAFGPLMGDQREDLKRIHSASRGLHTLLMEIITSFGVENIARWVYLENKLDQTLDPILHNSQVLSDGIDGPLTGEQLRSVHHIAEIGQMLRRNVDKLWLYSRLVNDRFDLQLAPLDLAEIQAQISLPETKPHVNLALSIPGDIPKIRGDQQAMRIALEELIINAIQFTEYGTIHILVQHTRSHVVIRVKDSGSGISTAHQKHIFNPFFQGSRFRTGVGLGLSITRELMERQGGRVWLQHTSDTGSTFALQIPAAQPYF